VDGAALLDALDSLVRKHVVIEAHAAVASALWIVLTYLSDVVSILPKLLITSPVKRSGKTTLLTVLSGVVWRAVPLSNITAPALYRTIEKIAPTLLLDEIDTYLTREKGGELIGIINAGHTRRAARVMRCDPVTLEPRWYSAWAPQVLSGIDKPADTIVDRSIIIAMERKSPSTKVAELREDRFCDDWRPLRQQARRWANDHADLMKAADPAMPAGLHDRAIQNWRVLIAIADLAGRDWPAKARAAALALSESDGEDEPFRVQLLADIRSIFNERGGERLRSTDLLKCLVELEDRPWSAYTRNGQPISGHGVAHLLKGFKVRPTAYKESGRTVKGYRREDFEAAWSSYLPAEPDSIGNSVTASENIDKNRSGNGNRPADGLPIEIHETPNDSGAGYRVTDAAPAPSPPDETEDEIRV
jgi:hypothetical protein